MPKFALEPGGPKRLELRWKLTMNRIEVLLDGQQAGIVEGVPKSPEGKTLTLPDRSELLIQLKRGLMPVLHVVRDGRPVPGSPGDPEQAIRNAANLLFFIAGFNILIGIASAVSPGGILSTLGAGGWSAADGAVFGVLGVFTRRKSRLALGAAIVLYVIETFFVLVTMAEATGRPNVGGIIVRIFFATYLVRGWSAMGQLKKAAVSAAPGPGATG